MKSYNVVELIKKTRDGQKLLTDELQFLVDGFSDGSIPDYQVSSWLMAVCLKGLSVDETFTLTQFMRNSGAVMDWKKEHPELYAKAHIVDKHSSGGIGDKVSFILLSICASIGMKIPMMGGRGLGHTGGTVDKLESIPGFVAELSVAQVKKCFEEVGCYIIGQSQDICPADKKLYALRDVTGTVESLELITASIVSKKWSEGLDAIVYDVKCGSAAFMETIDDARALARSLVSVSKKAGMEARAVISSMQEPLGAYVGNSLEIKETLSILGNNFEDDNKKRLAQPLTDLCLNLAAHMAVLSGLGKDFDEMRRDAFKVLENGAALQTFRKLIKAHGGKEGWESQLPLARKKLTLVAKQSGTISAIHSKQMGLTGLRLGMGRIKTDDKLNFGVGYEMFVAKGDSVSKGQPLLTLYYDGSHDEAELSSELYSMFEFGHGEPLTDLVLEIID